MRLLRLKADGFGALRGEYAFDPTRLTIVVDDNERGKSTLIAAVCAALYGLDGDRRSHRVLTPRDRWKPWDGGTFKVELELECAGGRYVIRRDLEEGTVEVWDGGGREVTPEFRDGKEDYPVGAKLLGLDADEFAKCALVRQGELDQVVPADEKTRRLSTLAARLENAADTRVGDTNASEALRVLDAALRKYTCPEVESSGAVDTAVQRLELKREMLDADLKTLEHEIDQVSDPLDELARLGEEEKTTRAALVGLEDDRRRSLAGDLKRQLSDQAGHREKLEQLEQAAETLAPAAQLPPNAEAQFQEAVARWQEAQRNLQALESRRADETQRGRAELDRDMVGLHEFQHFTPADADASVTLAAELRRIEADDVRLREDVFRLREVLASRGHDPERFNWLTQRLGRFDVVEQGLLRKQSELAFAYQTEVSGLEQERTTSSETLRSIDALRHRWRAPGGAFIAAGVAGTLGGIAVVAMKGLPTWSTVLFAVGGTLIAVGVILLASGSRARERERSEALRTLTEAQRRLTELRTSRAETETGLGELSARMGYRDQVELLREWNEYARMFDESSPALRAQEQLAGIEERRRDTHERARVLLERAGGGPAEPARLETVAASIRKLQGLYQRGTELEKSWEWIDAEKRNTEAQASGLKERAQRILQSAGLTYDPERSWEVHGHELAERMQSRARHATLVEDLIPQARRFLLPAEEVAEIERQLAMLENTPERDTAEGPRRSLAEIESENRRLREALDQIQKRRADLRVAVEETWRRFHSDHPDKLAQRERVAQALIRARRFKHTVELARNTIQSVATETHRRWAEHLNQRVAELLGAAGAHIEQLRFGDDLDFSIRLPGGQQLTRGKADLQLSAGARDQLYLAVRLAVSEFLSRTESRLPLLLDDVFVTSDDERTRNGMRALIDHFAAEHQVILLTCHRARYQMLAQLDPEVYSERVHWLDLGASSPVRA